MFNHTTDKVIKTKTSTVTFYKSGMVEIVLNDGYKDVIDAETVKYIASYEFDKPMLSADDYETLAELFTEMI